MASERLSLHPDSITVQAIMMNELLNAALEPTLAENGMKPATFDLLSAIEAAGPDATQSEIARRLGIKPPSLTEALRGLKHLVAQEPSSLDSRVKNLILTEQGKKGLGAAIKAIESLTKSAVSGIDRDQMAAAIDVMRKANRNLAQKLS